MTSKAALLCFISTGLVTAFKLLYEDLIETVDRPLRQRHPNSPPFLVIAAREGLLLGFLFNKKDIVEGLWKSF